MDALRHEVERLERALANAETGWRRHAADLQVERDDLLAANIRLCLQLEAIGRGALQVQTNVTRTVADNRRGRARAAARVG